MKKLPDHWYLRTAGLLLAGWTALMYFWLGRVIDAGFGDPGEGRVTPAAALWLGGVAGIFWLLTHLFVVPPSPPDDNPNIG